MGGEEGEIFQKSFVSAYLKVEITNLKVERPVQELCSAFCFLDQWYFSLLFMEYGVGITQCKVEQADQFDWNV